MGLLNGVPVRFSVGVTISGLPLEIVSHPILQQVLWLGPPVPAPRSAKRGGFVICLNRPTPRTPFRRSPGQTRLLTFWFLTTYETQ